MEAAAPAYRTPPTILDLATRLVAAAVVESRGRMEVVGRLRLPDGEEAAFRSRSAALAALIAENGR